MGMIGVIPWLMGVISILIRSPFLTLQVLQVYKD